MSTDSYGTVYRPTYGPDTGSTPTSGTPVTIIHGDGTTSQGTWMGQVLRNS